SPTPSSPDELQALAIQDANATQRLATSPAGVEAIHDEGWDTPPKRRLPLVLAGSAIAVAAALALVFLLPERGSEGATVAPSGTIFSDERATEVPVLPRAESVAVAGALPSDSSSISDLAARAADSARGIAALSPAEGTRASALDSLRAAAAARLAAPEDPPLARGRDTSASARLRAAGATVSPPPPPAVPVPPAAVAAAPGARSATDSLASARDSASGTVRATGAPVVFPAERGTIAAGGRHSCMIDNAGRARCWGNNERGQLGDGTYEGRPTPSPTAGELAFASLSAGGWHTCGVSRDGDLLCWGSNDAGQLGDGTTIPRAAPVRVTGSATYRLVRAGQSHSCALSRGG
ncbi:MAG TPA: hypothetical protein VFX50_18795, partial [Gemmatimonadales bacterium]|nr:hypothetical protein [Gemmatimonadales bacterium]